MDNIESKIKLEKELDILIYKLKEFEKRIKSFQIKNKEMNSIIPTIKEDFYISICTIKND